MTILRRSHPHHGPYEPMDEAGEMDSDGSTCKGHAVPVPAGRRKIRQWSFSKAKEQVEDWLLVTACLAVLLVCVLWFFSKVVAVVAYLLLPLVDSMVLSWKGDPPPPIHRAAHSHYNIPHAHPSVGDRSLEYAILRQEIDATFPEDPARSLQRIQELQRHRGLAVAPTIPLDHNSDQLPQPAYDIYHCPSTPPEGYPFQWKLTDVVRNWNPEDTHVPNMIYNGLCVFDYQEDLQKAMTYRNAEVPFVVVNDHRVAATAERWNAPGYLQRLLGDVRHRTTRSDTNHFLYAIPPPTGNKHRRVRTGKHVKTAPPGWQEPTESLRMSYANWLAHANVTSAKSTPDKPHWYYRLIGCGLTGPDGSCDQGSSEYLYDEMPYFQPTPGGLYLRDAEQQKGIHCRFGQEGIVADNHFDAGRNTIVVLGGSRR